MCVKAELQKDVKIQMFITKTCFLWTFSQKLSEITSILCNGFRKMATFNFIGNLWNKDLVIFPTSLGIDFFSLLPTPCSTEEFKIRGTGTPIVLYLYRLSSNFVHILLAPSTKNHHGWRIYATSMSTIRETVNTADLLACPLVSPVNITNSRNCANWLHQNHYWKEWEANRKYLLEPHTLGSQAPVGSGRNFFCRWRCAD